MRLECSELGAIQDHAPATTLAFADHFAAALHTLSAADWTDYLIFLQFLVRLGLGSLHSLLVALMRLACKR